VLIPTNGGPGTLAVFFQGDSFNGDAGGIADVQFYDASGAAGMRKHTFTVPQELVTDGVAGKARSVQFKSTGLGNAFVTGATTRDTTNPGLEIIVAGVAGGRMADWSRDVDTSGFNDTTFNVVPSLAALLDDAATVPTTFIVEGWANDWEANHSITTTQVKALAASLIAKLQPYGDVIWMGYAPMTPEYGGTDLESLIPVYNEAVFAAASDAGCAVVDPRVLFPDWTTGYTVLGLNADAQHPTAAGHAIIARAIIAALDAAF
jgi:hypothetical protein